MGVYRHQRSRATAQRRAVAIGDRVSLQHSPTIVGEVIALSDGTATVRWSPNTTTATSASALVHRGRSRHDSDKRPAGVRYRKRAARR